MLFNFLPGMNLIDAYFSKKKKKNLIDAWSAQLEF